MCRTDLHTGEYQMVMDFVEGLAPFLYRSTFIDSAVLCDAIFVLNNMDSIIQTEFWKRQSAKCLNERIIRLPQRKGRHLSSADAGRLNWIPAITRGTYASLFLTSRCVLRFRCNADNSIRSRDRRIYTQSNAFAFGLQLKFKGRYMLGQIVLLLSPPLPTHWMGSFNLSRDSIYISEFCIHLPWTHIHNITHFLPIRQSRGLVQISFRCHLSSPHRLSLLSNSLHTGPVDSKT